MESAAVALFVGMVVVMVAEVTTIEITKIAMSRGINKYVLTVYAYAFSLLVLIPSAFFLHRSDRTPVTFSLLSKFFLLSIFGSFAQIFGYAGLQYSSATLGTAMLNLIPAFTFILAIIFRLEKLDWRSKSTISKSLGTIIAIGGAFVVTFYKGPTVFGITPLQLFHTSPQFLTMIGGLFLMIQAFMYSAIYILQAVVLRKFPAFLIVLCYDFGFAAILCTIFALVVVKDTSAWILRFDMGLFAILYAAIIGNAFRISLTLWCLKKTGPLYVAMFKPLATVLAVIIDVSFLKDVISLGSLIGVTTIVTGFYMVLWGKAKEDKKTTEDIGVTSVESSNNRIPLLSNTTQDV